MSVIMLNNVGLHSGLPKTRYTYKIVRCRPVVQGHSRSLKLAPIERADAIYYERKMLTLVVFCTISAIVSQVQKLLTSQPTVI